MKQVTVGRGTRTKVPARSSVSPKQHAPRRSARRGSATTPSTSPIVLTTSPAPPVLGLLRVRKLLLVFPKLFLGRLANPPRAYLPVEVAEGNIFLLLHFLVDLFQRVSPQRILDDSGYGGDPTYVDPDPGVVHRLLIRRWETRRGHDSRRGENILQTGTIIFLTLFLFVFVEAHRDGMSYEFVHGNGWFVRRLLLPFAFTIVDEIWR
jgi:hypothetical protein